MNTPHRCIFVLKDDVSIGILYRIIRNYDITPAVSGDSWVLVFYMNLTHDEVDEFIEEYDWCIDYKADLNQKQPEGSYI